MSISELMKTTDQQFLSGPEDENVVAMASLCQALCHLVGDEQSIERARQALLSLLYAFSQFSFASASFWMSGLIRELVSLHAFIQFYWHAFSSLYAFLLLVRLMLRSIGKYGGMEAIVME